MKQAIILTLCFLPLAVIYIVMKLSLLLSSSASEIKHVKEEAQKPHGPYIINPYEDVDIEED
jgi:hypothetical protein